MDHIESRLINDLLEHGKPVTQRFLRDSFHYNYRPLKNRLESLVERKLIRKNLGWGKVTYDIGEPEWKRIVEEQARDNPGKMFPSLPLEEVRAFNVLKDSSRVKMGPVTFELVFEDQNSGVIVRIENGAVVTPRVVNNETHTSLVFGDSTYATESVRTRKFTVPRAQAGPVVSALAREQWKPVSLPNWF